MTYQRLLFLLLIGLVVIVGLFWAILDFDLTIKFTFVAIIIAFFIAFVQQYQLAKLEKISRHTGETVEKIKTESIIHENVTKFFLLTHRPGGKYKCIVPVEYRSKPLPVINQGDFYAIHVLNTRLGEDNIELRGITKDESIDDDLLTGNIIYICSPNVNPALKKLFNFKKIHNDHDNDNFDKWPLSDLEIPCWFVEDHRNPDRPVKKIKISTERINELIESPADKCYSDARGLAGGVRYKPEKHLERDHGIFARISRDDNLYIIIAGIHQYGTWIISGLISELLSGKKIDCGSIFLDNKDFIAVISGEFDNHTLTVVTETIEVYRHYIWVKDMNNWVRAKK